eukprot:scaffold105302_cov63-Phaeocystis_antarctica.AAC.1
MATAAIMSRMAPRHALCRRVYSPALARSSPCRSATPPSRSSAPDGFFWAFLHQIFARCTGTPCYAPGDPPPDVSTH